MNVNFSPMWAKINSMIHELINLIPNLFLAIFVLTMFYFAARGARSLVGGITDKYGLARGVGVLLGRLAQVMIVIVGMLLALSVMIPSFRAVDLIQLLGVSSVAIGFAFRDIFQNFLAGILLLMTQPFRIGDQIVFNEFEGTVEDVQTRATLIRTYDGRRVVIPNANLFTNAVTVNTAFPQRRSQYEWGVSKDAEIERIKREALDAIRNVRGVLKDPPPMIFAVALDDTKVKLRAQWWTTPERTETLAVQDQVVTAIKGKLMGEESQSSDARKNRRPGVSPLASATD
jgi:small-conductance mechanosensitive channel